MQNQNGPLKSAVPQINAALHWVLPLKGPWVHETVLSSHKVGGCDSNVTICEKGGRRLKNDENLRRVIFEEPLILLKVFKI